MDKSIILTGADFDSENIAATAKKISERTDIFYLLSTSAENLRLHEVIDKLSKAFSEKSALTRVRLAYDVNFTLPTELRVGNENSGVTVKSFAELLDKLDFDENLVLRGKNYHVVIDDISAKDDVAASAVAKLFQQTVFLNLDLDIKKKTEFRAARMKERFRKNFDKLCENIELQKKNLGAALDNSDLTDKGKERVKNMLDALNKTVAEIQKAKARPIKIAAMGTKKAGKSVVINSILKCDYAPTSSELPTTNVIKYIPAEKNSDLILEYKGAKKVFNSAEELSDFIGAEFKNAQNHTGEGSELDDMTIYYPSGELSGYEVWDTPGPNFAGAGKKHEEIAKKCIEAADICIFVMNYSQHLTADEVNFLRDIRTTFDENNKFYSLFITVNRIDERYTAEVEKSVNRVLDYIGKRLDELDYKNILLFGTSALQSFYLQKIIETLRADGKTLPENLSEIDFDELADDFPELDTQIDFVEGQIKRLKRFHRIKNPTAKIFENFSGVPQLWRHVNYIGEQKVDTEIVNGAIFNCEMQFNAISNALLVTDLKNLSEEDKARLEELQKNISDLQNVVEGAMNEVNFLANDRESHLLKSTKFDISEQIKRVRRESISTSVERSQAMTKRSNLSKNDVKAMQSGNITENVKKLLTDVDEMISGVVDGAERRFLKVIELEGGNISKKIEIAAQSAQEKIIFATENLKKSVASDTVAGDMIHAFTVPSFPVSLKKLSGSSQESLTSNAIIDKLSDIADSATKIEYEQRTRTVRVKNENKSWWQFWKDSYVNKTENYQEAVENVNVEKFNRDLAETVAKYIENSLNATIDAMEDDVQEKIGEIFSSAGEQCSEIGKNYSNIFEIFAQDINAAINFTSEQKKSRDKDIEILTEIKEKIQPFFDLWKKILYSEED